MKNIFFFSWPYLCRENMVLNESPHAGAPGEMRRAMTGAKEG
jgi:hypothetical protein